MVLKKVDLRIENEVEEKSVKIQEVRKRTPLRLNDLHVRDFTWAH